jgi:hypothetical protein
VGDTLVVGDTESVTLKVGERDGDKLAAAGVSDTAADVVTLADAADVSDARPDPVEVADSIAVRLGAADADSDRVATMDAPGSASGSAEEDASALA